MYNQSSPTHQHSLTKLLRYKTNGILHMLDRNRRIKPKPERFQASKDTFDIIISCEERVFDQIIEGMLMF